MSLQDSALGILAARRGRFAHHDVSGIVLESVDAMLLSPVEQELLNILEVSAWSRNLRQEVKVLPDNLRIEVFDKLFHSLCFNVNDVLRFCKQNYKKTMNYGARIMNY